MLVDWLVEVVDVFEMSTRRAFLAVQYVDRYLGTTMMSRSRFQLLGATCLHIASKCEDVSYIGVDDLAVPHVDMHAPARSYIRVVSSTDFCFFCSFPPLNVLLLECGG